MPLRVLDSRSAGSPWPELRPYVTGRLAPALDAIPPDAWRAARELRLRVGRPATLRLLGDAERAGPEITPSDLAESLEHLTQHSLYAWEAELGSGFLTIPGGHRVGVAGRVVEISHGRRTIRDVQSLNYRIARSVNGVAGAYLPRICERGRALSTLILGPPGSGKTTLLRDLVRSASDGLGGLRAHQVALVDERSEVAASHLGVPGRDVGARTDVLDGCPKALGMRMALRALGPEVIATDELGGAEDATVVADLSHAGVTLFATAHAAQSGALQEREELSLIARGGAFQRLIVLREPGAPGEVLDLQPRGRGEHR